MKKGAESMEEKKPTVRQFVRAFSRGKRDDLEKRFVDAALGKTVFIGEDEIAVIRNSDGYKTDVQERNGDYFLKEWIEIEFEKTTYQIKVIASGSFSVQGIRIRGFLMKG